MKQQAKKPSKKLNHLAGNHPVQEVDALRGYKGIGPKMAQILLDHFGTATAAIESSHDELVKVAGRRGKAFWKLVNKGIEPKTGRRSAYNDKELVNSILKDYGEGEGTIEEIMKKHGLSLDRFFEWQQIYPEFHDKVKEIKKLRQYRSYEMALIGKKKLLQGHTVEELTQVGVAKKDGSGAIEPLRIQKTQKYYPPSATMIVFELINSSRGEFRDVRHITYQGRELPPYDLSKLSDEELKEFERILEKAEHRDDPGDTTES